MYEQQVLEAQLPFELQAEIVDFSEPEKIPRAIYLSVTGILVTLLGALWDMTWHMSVGREIFWTPAHITIGLGALICALACASAMSAVKSATPKMRASSVHALGLYGPGGAFIILWGSLAMMASTPFDYWWHNAYGLDVQFLTPPHGLLSIGYFAIRIGLFTWIASVINDRPNPQLRARLAWMILIVGAVCVVFPPVPTPLTLRTYMHTGVCYLAVACFTPFMMIAASRGAATKWGCTAVASIYTFVGVASEWLLPLIPAQPELGPVYHQITRLVPLQFPLLLIAPALLSDFLLQRLRASSSWKAAACVGPAFVLSFMAVQWPFASFLASPASRNWIFGSGYLAYCDPAGVLYDAYRFKPTETPGTFALTIFFALVVAAFTTRLGLGFGNWMRRVRR